MISSEKWQRLRKQMTQFNIKEEDLTEKFILGSGRGGQKIHKTASCVYLKHNPTGIEIKSQKSRFREDNRFYARRRLCEKYQAQILQEKTAAKQAAEKIKRQKKRRSRKAKQKMLAEKHHRSQIKTLRKLPKTNSNE